MAYHKSLKFLNEVLKLLFFGLRQSKIQFSHIKTEKSSKPSHWGSCKRELLLNKPTASALLLSDEPADCVISASQRRVFGMKTANYSLQIWAKERCVSQEDASGSTR